MKFRGLKSIYGTVVAATIILAAVSQPANSATVNFISGSTTIAADVTGVVVGSNTYNVDFVGNISSDTWLTQLDFTNSTDAFTAASALAAALNAAGVVSLSLELATGTILDDVTFVSTPYGDDGTNLLGAGISGSSGTWSTTSASFPLGSSAFPFAADWTLTSTVPVPAALPLLLSGLVGLGLIGWRKRKAV